MKQVKRVFRVCESHAVVYEYLKRLAADNKIIKVKYRDIERDTKLTYPIVAKCMVDLIDHGCVKKLIDGKGHRDGGSEYAIDSGFKVFKKRVTRVKVYKTKYQVTILDLKKEAKLNERGAN